MPDRMLEKRRVSVWKDRQVCRSTDFRPDLPDLQGKTGHAKWDVGNGKREVLMGFFVPISIPFAIRDAFPSVAVQV
jgi:hypothetical protein